MHLRCAGFQEYGDAERADEERQPKYRGGPLTLSIVESQPSDEHTADGHNCRENHCGFPGIEHDTADNQHDDA